MLKKLDFRGCPSLEGFERAVLGLVELVIVSSGLFESSLVRALRSNLLGALEVLAIRWEVASSTSESRIYMIKFTITTLLYAM